MVSVEMCSIPAIICCYCHNCLRTFKVVKGRGSHDFPGGYQRVTQLQTRKTFYTLLKSVRLSTTTFLLADGRCRAATSLKYCS